MPTSILDKAEASGVDCAIILMTGAMLEPVTQELWKPTTLALCLAYNFVFNPQSPGTMWAKIYFPKPTSAAYVTFYTLGFACILYYAWMPFDLLVAYIVLQLSALKTLGNTIPGLLTGHKTMTRAEHIAQIKARAIDQAESGNPYTAVCAFIMDMRKLNIGQFPELNLAIAAQAQQGQITDVVEFIQGFPND